ncbi:MAG: polysaccharide deacetylase family protein [Eubacteriales bacterium]|nr:polysaccharide deacetylase family protein [Eubacteriales bacterium]
MKRVVEKTGLVLLLVLQLLLLAGVSAGAEKITVAPKTALKNVTEAPVVEGKWIGSGSRVRYQLTDGSYLEASWLKVGTKVYYLNEDGYRTTGWVKYRKNHYFLNKKGVLQTGRWLKKKYYLTEKGARAKGLVTIDGRARYFDKKTGIRQTGWVKIGQYYYYFLLKSGSMKINDWVKEDGKYYYVDGAGRQLRSKWLSLEGKRYYLDEFGVRVTGGYFIKDKGYYFKDNGEYDPKVKVTDAVDPKKPMVALTFDDGPGPYTDRLLNCLERNGAKATFFMVGSSVPSYKGTVSRMVKLGCELGNHSYSHPAFTSLSAESRQSQVSSANHNIYAAAGKMPTVFRLPYGDGAANAAVLGSLGLPSIYWSLDTRDWANTGSPQHTVNAVLNHVKSGDIVLMHDIHASTVQAAEQIIPALKARGYQMVTVSQLAKYKGKTVLKNGVTYHGFS